MRYIDWIAFAYRMRNIVKNIKIELDAIFDFDIETRIEKFNSYFAEINGALEFMINADAKNALTSLLGIQAYQELLVEVQLLKSLILFVSSDVNGELIIEGENIISNTRLLKVDTKLDFNILVKALDSFTRLTNVKTMMSELKINADVYAGILHEVTRTLEFTFDSLIDTVISNVIEMSLETISINETTIHFEIVLASILDAFYFDAEFTSSVQLNEVKTKISKANTKFDLDINVEVKKEIMRKLLDTYPTPLSSVLEMSIVDFYYIYE